MDADTTNQILDELVHSLVTLDDPDAVYSCIANSIRKILPMDRSSISLIYPNARFIETKCIVGKGSDKVLDASTPFEIEGTAIEAAVREKRARIWNPDTDRDYRESGIMRDFGFISIINCPIFINDEIIASINVASTSVVYSEKNRQLFKHLANTVSSSVNRLRHLAISNANARRHETYAKHLEILNDISRQLSEDDSMLQALQTVATGTSKLINAERVSYCTLEPNGEYIVIEGLISGDGEKLGTRVSLEESGLENVLLKGENRFLTDLQNSPSAATRRLAESGLNFLWSFPIITQHGVQGALNFGSANIELEPEDGTAILLALSRQVSATFARINAQRSASHALESLVDDCPLMLCMLDESGRLLRLSRFGAEGLGYEDKHLSKQTFADLHPTDEQAMVSRRMDHWLSMPTDKVDSCEVLMTTKQGNQRWIRQTARCTTDYDGNTRLLVVCEDIHELKAMASRISLQARTDALTGLANRSEFNSRLTQTIHRHEQQSAPSNCGIAVMFFDLDNFKNINDTLGHMVGDRVLRTIATRIKGAIPSEDLVARIGGDEFLAMVNYRGDNLYLQAVSEKMINVISEPLSIGSQLLHISTSMGISCYPDHGLTAVELIKNADIAMYKAKDLGKNQFYRYTTVLSEELVYSAKLEHDLILALENDDLSLVYQPQVNMDNGQIECLEALLRWNHKEDGFISPDVFIPIAERTGLIIQITDWVMTESLSTLNRIREYSPAMKMAINVSAIEFGGHYDLLDRVLNAVEQAGLEPTAIELELTETALLENPQNASAMVHKLSEAGVQISVDDFGTGYGSLNYLVHLPIDAIKIDRSFVNDVDTDRKKQAVVAGLATIASNLDLRCIGEGIETIAQRDWLSSCGCNYAQGYLFSRPVTESTLKTTIDSILQISANVKAA